MKRSFYIILIAQFLSALADNALLFAAIALLRELHSPDWHEPLLLQFFVISYIVLAPFVGSIADAYPKGRVMFYTNGIKIIGSLCMLLGMPPLYAYGIVGIGAAAYSPAKYGILTELLPPNALVAANGWIEGSTVAAIIIGAILGGSLATNDPHFAMAIITALYVAAAIFNHYIPPLPIDHKTPSKNPLYLIQDFYIACKRLWLDQQGQVSLTVTTLFWGAGATLRLGVIAWAAYALAFDLAHATQLIAIVAVGVAIGAAIAARYVTLENSVKVLPAGIVMGLLVILMVFMTDWRLAGFVLFLIGMLSGFFVVPLNALLQHRGHQLIGAGHSIAVQNFNENLGILVMVGVYTWLLKIDISIHWIMIGFGIFISLAMTAINRYYRDVKADI